MRTEAEQDELIRKALLDTLAFEWADTLAAAPAAPMSTRQAKRMNAMLRDPIGYARHYARPKWKWIAEKVAIFILLFALSFGALYAASPTVRATVSKWIAELRETDIVYYFFGEKSKSTSQRYEITSLPEGYASPDGIIEMAGYHYIIYESNNSPRIQLQYRFMDIGKAFSIETENMQIYNVTVDGCPGQILLADNIAQGSAITWINEEIGVQFYVDAYADKDTLLCLAESVLPYMN